VALSVFAVILVIGMPAIVSVMDSYVEKTAVNEYYHDYPLHRNATGTYVGYDQYLIDGMTRDILFDNDVVRIDFCTDGAVKKVELLLLATADAQSPLIRLDLDYMGGGHYTITLSTIEYQLLLSKSNGVYIGFEVSFVGNTNLTTFNTWTFEVQYFSADVSLSAVNAFAMLLAALFGFFLVTCAIFATPWVSRENVKGLVTRRKKGGK